MKTIFLNHPPLTPPLNHRRATLAPLPVKRSNKGKWNPKIQMKTNLPCKTTQKSLIFEKGAILQFQNNFWVHNNFLIKLQQNSYW